MSEPFSKKFNQWGVWIFEYLNKITLKYYLHSQSCYFRRTNIFRYLVGKCVASQYIRIFVWYIMLHPNIFVYLFVSVCSKNSDFQIYSNIYWQIYSFAQIFVDFFKANIFGYSFDTFFPSWIYSDIHSKC